MPRHLVIHGHFYQPPRENPWTGKIEKLDTPIARTVEEYNQQIDLQCYSPNSLAYLLQKDNVIKTVNNYEYLSFNLAPTLIDWLKENNFSTYQRIMRADLISQGRNNGHGNAIAQVYNHVIMPLAKRRDKLTQIHWGKAAFEQSYDRSPEAMWLGEAAIDNETVECLIETGMKFVIASPRGAAQIRPLGESKWHKVNDGILDTSHPYVIRLPQGDLPIFFFDSYYYDHIGGMLKDTNNFISSLNHRYPEDGTNKLILIATDGELYGHWEYYGERFLAYLFSEELEKHDIKVTNLGNYLELYPPTHEVRLTAASSWSCPHGVERWRSNCGCSDVDPGKQEFRVYLRKAIDELGENLYKIYEREVSLYLIDPADARNDILSLIPDDENSLIVFLNKHVKPEVMPLSIGEQKGIMNLLQAQKYAQLMFTSCAWFFSKLRIEALQILEYASRAIEYLNTPSLIREMENRLLETLEHIQIFPPINCGSIKISNGKDLYLFEIRLRAPKYSGEIEISTAEDWIYMKVPHDLVDDRSEQFQWKLRSLVIFSGYQNQQIILDLSEVNKLDNNAISAIMGFIPRLSEEGKKLKIYCHRRNVLELLQLSRLSDFVEIIIDPLKHD